MDFEDIISNYQELTRWKRMTFLLCVAVIPAIYRFGDNWGQVTTERENATQGRALAEMKLNDAKNKSGRLPELEAILIKIQNEFKEVSKKMPDEIFMDRVLQKTELIAQELGVAMNLFTPGKEVPSETAFKYIKQPIKIELVGTFGQIASFFDHVLHFETIVHIENFSLEPYSSTKDSKTETERYDGSDKKDEIKRALMRLKAKCDLVLYRTMTESEAQTSQSIADEKAKKDREEKKKNKTPIEKPI